MAMADRREREKKKRQHDIINAAEKLFFSKGYDKVSMNDIALAVELSKATLYLYFENKESLFFAIVLRGTKILNSMIIEQVENEHNGMDKVSAYRNAYYEFTKQYPDYIQIYNYFQSGRFNMANEEKPNKKPKSYVNSIPYVNECANEINRLRKERFSILCNSIQKGIDDETMRPDLDPVEVAVLLSAISKNLSHIPTDHEKALENRGISHEDYFKDVGLFIHHMIINRTD